MQPDLTHFTDKELDDLFELCKQKIVHMIADYDTVQLFAAVQKEQQSRENNGDI